MTAGEDILRKLFVLIAEAVPDATVLRNGTVPEEIPDGGLVIIRDGDPGAPDEVLGGFRDVFYQHSVDIELYAAHAVQETRDATFGYLLKGVGAALEANLTLGGLCAGFSYGAPAASTEPTDGGHDIKQGVLTLLVDYTAAAPLS